MCYTIAHETDLYFMCTPVYRMVGRDLLASLGGGWRSLSTIWGWLEVSEHHFAVAGGLWAQFRKWLEGSGHHLGVAGGLSTL